MGNGGVLVAYRTTESLIGHHAEIHRRGDVRIM
jgi:hypothetical protein